MNDKADEIIKDYFSDKRLPSPETKAILHDKLLIAKQRRKTKWSWAVMVYAILFSMAIMFALWVLTANSMIVFISTVLFLFSLISGVIITIACQNKRVKGGNTDAVILD